MSWTRTYRPKSIAGLHSKSVRTSIQNILKSGVFPQSFLFTGPKGTGKTSTSRIIATILNSEENAQAIDALFFGKKNTSNKLLDNKKLSEDGIKILSGESFMVNELDAASHRGIDDIRALKERIFLPPQQGKIAVYILDEVHMLTTEAFNAFLKLLEEPPEHVVFILATTERHKIPETIQSRCQVISFKKATKEELVDALSNIVKEEQLRFADDALEIIAKHSDGSFRDAVKLLELAYSQQAYSSDAIQSKVLNSKSDLASMLIETVVEKKPQQVVSLIQEARDSNIAPKHLVTQLFNELHSCLLTGHGVAEGSTLVSAPIAEYLLRKLTTVNLLIDTPIQHLPLELALLEIISLAQQSGKKKSKPVTKKPVQVPVSDDTQQFDQTLQPLCDEDQELLTQSFSKSQRVQTQDKVNCEARENVLGHLASPQSSSQEIVDLERNSTADIVPNSDDRNVQGDGQKLCEAWDAFVQKVAINNSTYAALLRSAKPLSGTIGIAQIAVYYNFHCEQLSKFQHTPASIEAITSVAGGAVKLNFVIETIPASAELVSAEHKNSAGNQVMELLS